MVVNLSLYLYHIFWFKVPLSYDDDEFQIVVLVSYVVIFQFIKYVLYLNYYYITYCYWHIIIRSRYEASFSIIYLIL